MSITLQWDNSDKTVIRWDFDGRWSVDQFAQVFQTAMVFASGVAHPVIGLGVLNNDSVLSVADITDAVVTRWPDNLQALVFVGASHPMARALKRLGGSWRRKGPRIVFVDTLPEAYALVERLMAEAGYS